MILSWFVCIDVPSQSTVTHHESTCALTYAGAGFPKSGREAPGLQFLGLVNSWVRCRGAYCPPEHRPGLGPEGRASVFFLRPLTGLSRATLGRSDEAMVIQASALN